MHHHGEIPESEWRLVTQMLDTLILQLMIYKSLPTTLLA